MVIMNLRDEIKYRIDLISGLSKKAEEKVNSFPEERIKIKHYKNGSYFYIVDSSNTERYLNKNNKELIQQLFQKKYLEEVLKLSLRELKVLKKIQKEYPEVLAEELYESLDEASKAYIKPIIPTDEQFIRNWLNRSYKKKSIRDDVPVYITMKGERVRSKSEQIIADRLYTKGIPDKYECPIKVGDEIIHPDFTILRVSDRKILYLEHCGKMNDAGYIDDMIDRSRKYALEGIIQGDRLFYTFESSSKPLDVRVIDKMIDELFR